MATGVKRIHILGLPLDVVDNESLQEAIEQFYTLKEHRQIILLDFHGFMKARHNSELKSALLQAALIIPVSSLLTHAAGFLKLKKPPLRRTYPFVIQLLGILEQKNKSIYLLGSTMKGIRKAESTLRTTFPELQIVGRYTAHFPAEREADVVTAIKKASPTLLLAGRGIKGRSLWISRRQAQLSAGLSLWEKTCFDVFSGKKPKPNDSTGARLFKGFFNSLIRPWRFFRGFRYLFFYIMILIERIRS